MQHVPLAMSSRVQYHEIGKVRGGILPDPQGDGPVASRELQIVYDEGWL